MNSHDHFILSPLGSANISGAHSVTATGLLPLELLLPVLLVLVSEEDVLQS